MGVRSLGDLMDCISVTLQADHSNILYWYNSKDPVMRRWWFEFALTNSPIQHIPGESNVVADGLSRSPTPSITPSRPVAGPNLETTLMAPISILVPSAREARAAARAAPRPTTAPTKPTPATPTPQAAPPPQLSLAQLLDLRLTDRDNIPDNAFSAKSWLRAVHAAQIEHLPELQREAATHGGHTVKLSTINDITVYTVDGKVLIPPTAQALQLDVLARAHDGAGHPGCGQTAQNLRSVFLTNKTATIAKYVASCPACQHAKAPGDPGKEGTMSSVPPLGPWHTIIMDFTGELPQSDKNYKYIISLTDTFTRMSYWKAVKKANFQRVLQSPGPALAIHRASKST